MRKRLSSSGSLLMAPMKYFFVRVISSRMARESREFDGLGVHEFHEFFAGEILRAVEEDAVEIFVEGDQSGVERWEAKVVAVLEFFPVQVKDLGGFFAR